MITLAAGRSAGFPQRIEVSRPPPSSAALSRREDVPPNALNPGLLSAASSNMDLLFALQVYARDARRDLAEASVTQKRTAAESARQEMREAIKKAREEAEKKAGWGGILSKLTTVAQVAGVVAAAASLAASGGMSAPLVLGLAGTLLSLSAKPVGEAVGSEALEKGMFYAGAGLGLAGCAVGGVQLAAGCGKAAGNGASAATSVFRGFAKAGTIVAGSAGAASGYAQYRVGLQAARELEARAEEKKHKAVSTSLMREMNDFIEQLKDAEASFNRALKALTKAQEQQGESNLTLVTLGVRS
ncbi:MAG TPA: hypothetical protein VK524_15185 [Polyangiaceae bacterium]|nr:hypothetical protein [Polyangiaceae bacterium]